MTASACPTPETLAAFPAGALSAAAAADLERHLDDCTACRIALSSLARGRAPAGPERYRMLAPLGGGAMGDVIVAHDRELDRRVAIKLMREVEGGGAAAGSGEPTEQRQLRMLREARLLAQIDHPNVVRVLDVGRDDTGHVWIAMELIDGGTLRAWLAAPRTPDEILDAFLAAGRGLAAVHAAGVVHRDVKPDNLLIDAHGRVVVGDFGLAVGATPREGAAPDPRLTASNVALGTPGYMAPEQQLGGTVDARCDQFALCLALWEALFGARPFDDPDPAARMVRIARADLAPPPQAPPSLRAVAEVLQRGLRLAPDERYSSMPALLDALAAARRRADRARPRRPRALALLAIGSALAAVAVIAIAAHRLSGPPAPAPAPSSSSSPAPASADPLADPLAALQRQRDTFAELAARIDAARAAQVTRLDQRVAEVQRLILAGSYDDAELRLADLRWIPVEPGAASEEPFARAYDAKREALRRVLDRKRAE